MTEKFNYRGSCFCGEVSYVALGKPQGAAICHCRSCQRAFGAQSVAWACFKSEQIQWHGNTRKFFESSEGVKRTFCSRCGTSLSYQAIGNTLDLAIASLDDPEAIKPEREVFLSHRIAWNTHHPEIPGFQKFKSDE